MEKVILSTNELTGKWENFVVTQEDIDEVFAEHDNGKDVNFLPSHSCILYWILQKRIKIEKFKQSKENFNKHKIFLNDPDYKLYLELQKKFSIKKTKYEEIREQVLNNWEKNNEND